MRSPTPHPKKREARPRMAKPEKKSIFVRVDKDVYDEIWRMAMLENRTVSALVRSIINDRLSHDKQK